ncbi:hypothetical protein [Methanoculleus chikugoensis]|uniref:hypothetical protein n=1 Tax=Methanoculleus chikugoensis TaxID=118126 RepID=UPI001FB29894|nr:hypothetical protein [Methanoculleus chikugoensis]
MSLDHAVRGFEVDLGLHYGALLAFERGRSSRVRPRQRPGSNSSWTSTRLKRRRTGTGPRSCRTIRAPSLSSSTAEAY